MKSLSISKKPKREKVIECASRHQERTIMVDSQSSMQKYKVRYENQEGKLVWTCSCPAYTFRKPGVIFCKHIASVKDTVCKWKSSVGPEQQTKRDQCPRCKGLTIIGRSTS